MIELKMHQVEVLEALFAKTPKEARMLFARAINQSAESSRTKASQEVRAKYVIRALDVKKPMKVKKATASRLSAHVHISGGVTPLMKFDITPTMPDIMPVRARVKKGSSRKLIPHAFVAKMDNAHMNAFTRVGKRRLPIKGRYGPSIAQMTREPKVFTNITTHAQKTLDKRLDHEMNRLLYGG